MNILSSRIRAEREYGQLLENLRGQLRMENRAPAMVTGLCEGAENAFLAALVSEKITSSPALIIAHDEKTAASINAFLSGVGLRSMVYPVRDPVLYNIVFSHDTEHERIAVLTALSEDGVDVVVTVPDAAIQYTIPRGRLEKATLTVSEGETVSPTLTLMSRIVPGSGALTAPAPPAATGLEITLAPDSVRGAAAALGAATLTGLTACSSSSTL